MQIKWLEFVCDVVRHELWDGEGIVVVFVRGPDGNVVSIDGDFGRWRDRMKGRVKSKDKEERAENGALDKSRGRVFSVGKVTSVSNLEGTVTEIVFKIVAKVSLDVNVV